MKEKLKQLGNLIVEEWILSLCLFWLVLVYSVLLYFFTVEMMVISFIIITLLAVFYVLCRMEVY